MPQEIIKEPFWMVHFYNGYPNCKDTWLYAFPTLKECYIKSYELEQDGYTHIYIVPSNKEIQSLYRKVIQNTFTLWYKDVKAEIEKLRNLGTWVSYKTFSHLHIPENEYFKVTGCNRNPMFYKIPEKPIKSTFIPVFA